MHGDEAVHAEKLRTLWKSHRYTYDPNEFHGPTLYYATLPIVGLGRAPDFAHTTEATYRLVTVLFGVGLVLLTGLLARGLGWPAVLAAAVLTAVSPAMVFYSRYYIQEMLLAFFSLAAIACGWRYFQSGRWGWCVLTGLSLGLMHATKETCALVFASLGVALALTVAWSRRESLEPSGREGGRSGLRLPHLRRHLAWAAAAGLVASFTLLSGNFTNLRGPLDSLRTYTPWLGRAGVKGLHAHPWHYYLDILAWTHPKGSPVWSEGLILGLALVGLWVAFSPKRTALAGAQAPLVRFIAIYTLALTTAYSIIPYKTPWCLLGFLSGFILLAGVGVAALLRMPRSLPLRAVLAVVLLALTGQLAAQAYRASYVMVADARNPYVYAHPVPDVVTLRDRMEALARAHPRGHDMVVKVLAADDYYWPLPWYLRSFRNVGYWTAQPPDPGAPVVLADPEYDDYLVSKLDSTHLMTGYYGLRPGVFYEMWVDLSLWKSYLQKTPRKAAE